MWNLLQIVFPVNFLKTNLTKFAAIGVKKAQTGRFFAPDKLKSYTSKGKSEEEERKGRDTATAAFLVFTLATFWLWLDGRGLFGGNVFKNPAGYIFIADEKPTMYETAQEYSILISVTHNS